ncbi:MAG: D-sedoheptulose 7-phosphate isomerase [Bacteroidota bacterium]
MDQSTVLQTNLRSSIAVKQQMLSDTAIIATIETVNKVIIQCFQRDGKVFFCGNGGSAADAQHLAAELSGRYYYDRPPLFAEALHVNTSYLTAVANDYSYEEIYARLIRAVGREGDILIGLSTSGNSGNVVQALVQAKQQGMTTIGLTGYSGGKMANHCDLLINVPSNDTPRIQECHMLIGHSICEVVEQVLFPRETD